MDRRKFLETTVKAAGAVAVMTTIVPAETTKLRRCLRATDVSDFDTNIRLSKLEYIKNEYHEDDIKKAHACEEISFRDLEKGDIFFLSNDLKGMLFDGPLIAIGDVFDCGQDGKVNYGVKSDRLMGK